ncbi:MAG: hypothetical protein J6N52_08260 [Clostridia bacterium]|nr:hypothetical protein [Clostridia bacterium]
MYNKMKKITAVLLSAAMSGIASLSLTAAAENAFGDFYCFTFENGNNPGIEAVSYDVVSGYCSESAVKIVGDDYGENEAVSGVFCDATLKSGKTYTVSAKIKPVNISMSNLNDYIHLVTTIAGLEYYWYPKTVELGDGWYELSFDITRNSENEYESGLIFLRSGVNNFQAVIDDFTVLPKGIAGSSGGGAITYNYKLDDNNTYNLTANGTFEREMMYQPGYGNEGAAWKLSVPENAAGAADLYTTMKFTTNTDYKFSMKIKSLSENIFVTDTSWTFFMQASPNHLYNTLNATAIGDGWYLLESNIFNVPGDGSDVDIPISIRMWNAENHHGFIVLVDDIKLDVIKDEAIGYKVNFDSNGDGGVLHPNAGCAVSVVSPGIDGAGYAWRVTASASEPGQMADLYTGDLSLTVGAQYTYSIKMKIEEGSWDDVAMKMIINGSGDYRELQLTRHDIGNGWTEFSVPFTLTGEGAVTSRQFILRMQEATVTFTADDWQITADEKPDSSGLNGSGSVGSALTYSLPEGDFYCMVMGSKDEIGWGMLHSGIASGTAQYVVKESDMGKYIRFVIVSAEEESQIIDYGKRISGLSVKLPEAWSDNIAPTVECSADIDGTYMVAVAAYNNTGDMVNINLYTYSNSLGLKANGRINNVPANAVSVRAFVFESFDNIQPCCDYAELKK